MKKAAAQGHRDVVYCLGVCYEGGHDLDQAYGKAVEQYRKASPIDWGDHDTALDIAHPHDDFIPLPARSRARPPHPLL